MHSISNPTPPYPHCTHTPTALDPQGGFKKDEKIEVPKPRNISGGVKELLAQLVKDMKGVVEGKMPQPLSIVMVLFVTLLVAVLATAGMSQPATGTRRKVE